MRSNYLRRYLRPLIWVCLLAAVIYGSGRLYYRLTGGFMESNITYNLPYDSRWDVRPLKEDEKSTVDHALSQKYRYLGKGCQSYVFASEEGNYVLKFFKYQRFRPQAWLEYVSFIPAVDQYRMKKAEKKRKKLENVFFSWKIAFEDLKDETGVVFVHINKSHDLNKNVIIYDKIGLEHTINLDNMEFLLQKKADMLCPTINELMEKGNGEKAKQLLTNLMDLIVSEYKRGLADNDNALMQNTGVINGMPVHIDVGQFIKNSSLKNPEIYSQELFNKTYKFRLWLRKHHPELEQFLNEKLRDIIGSRFDEMKPILLKGSVAKLPNE